MSEVLQEGRKFRKISKKNQNFPLVSGTAGPRHGRGGPSPLLRRPRTSEPLCETAVFAMFILSTANFALC